MTTKHTPEPWQIGTRPYDVARADTFTGQPDDEVLEVVPIRAGLHEIALVPSADRANARLIAKAPRLLALVRRAFDDGAYSHIAGMNAQVRELLRQIDGEGEA